MDVFNTVIFLWQVSLVASVITLLYGLVKKSTISLIISCLTSLPVAIYFYGAENGFKWIVLAPILIVVAAILLRKSTSG